MSATKPLATQTCRRAFIAGTAALVALTPFRGALAKPGDLRRVNLYNTRTDERLDAIYHVRGTYLPDAMHAINRILRDVREEEVTEMDPRLIDIISASQFLIGHDRPFHVISGYRTQRTNDMLRRKSSGVAKKSYHIKGMAVDLRMEGMDAEQIDRVGKRLGCGGVGLYAGSNFVHLDSGPVRSWGG